MDIKIRKPEQPAVSFSSLSAGSVFENANGSFLKVSPTQVFVLTSKSRQAPAQTLIDVKTSDIAVFEFHGLLSEVVTA